MERYTPPFVAPRRTLTLDELRKRGFGEALYSQLTPEQRQQVLIMRDADELGDLITNREEAMAAETMLTNGCIMKHIADDADKSDEMEIRFYSEGANPATYTPTIKWDAEGAKIRADLGAMARMLTRRGLRAADLVCSPDVADAIVEDPDIKEMLDNRRYELGSVAPEELAPGASIMARLNINGRIISVISYDETYTDDDGNDQLYIPSGKCILTAPLLAVPVTAPCLRWSRPTESSHTYAGRRVPKYVSSAEGNTRTLTISSRPLLIPNNKNPWIVADVLTLGRSLAERSTNMIQIIAGTFGYYNGRKVVPINSNEADGPQVNSVTPADGPQGRGNDTGERPSSGPGPPGQSGRRQVALDEQQSFVAPAPAAKAGQEPELHYPGPVTTRRPPHPTRTLKSPSSRSP